MPETDIKLPKHLEQILIIANIWNKSETLQMSETDFKLSKCLEQILIIANVWNTP